MKNESARGARERRAKERERERETEDGGEREVLGTMHANMAVHVLRCTSFTTGCRCHCCRSGGAGGRLAAPRMSLLGRPVNYRATRRDARYRRLQARVYNFLERPRGVYAVTYHMIV